MRLKKIELFGFKSFADKTEIIFDQGVTCIVGPNGCGKSNISDSMRWVLGERSAKMLRGSKMEDIIFNGTEFRKPLAFAEVSLTIDNTDRGLPIEYNEVTITRRLHRSGESEYLINKTLCRLKDIQDLILDTGIGSNSYSMIEQGRIDYVLNANADERRFLIEEAAGISKFKVKKEEAIRKLERTEENRLRLNDIIHEVQKNIQYAERQAKRAAKYQEELEKLKKLQIKKAFYELSQIAAEQQALGEKIKTLSDSRAGNDEALQAVRKEAASVDEILRGILDRYREAESHRYTLQSRLEQNEQQLRFNQEKRLEMAGRRGQIEEEKRQLTERFEKNKQEIASKQQEIESLESDRLNAQAVFEKAESSFTKIQKDLEALKVTADTRKTETFDAAREASRLRNDYHRLCAMLESGEAQKKKQESNAARLSEEAKQCETRKNSWVQEIATLETRLQELQNLKTRWEGELVQVRKNLEQQTVSLAQQERQQHEKHTHLQVLTEIEHSIEAGEETLLANQNELSREAIASLRDIFEIEHGYEWALEAALESFTRSFVAKDTQTAEALIRRMMEVKTFSMGVFVQDANAASASAGTLSHPRIVRSLADVVRTKPGYQNLFSSFFASTYITENFSTELFNDLLPLAETNRFLTPEGVVLGTGKRIFYRNTALSSQDNRFKRSAEMRQLEADLKNLSELITQSKAAINSLETQFEIAEIEKEKVEAERIELTVRREAHGSMQKGIEDRLASFQRELELIYFESREIATKEEEGGRQKKNLETALAQAEADEKRLQEEGVRISHQLQALDGEREVALQTFAETKARFSNLDERTRLLQEALKLIQDNDTRDQARFQALTEEYDRMEIKGKELEIEDARLEAEQVQLRDSEREASIALELVRQDKAKSEEEAARLKDILENRIGAEQRFQSEMHQLEMKQMDLGFKDKGVHDRLAQTYRIQLAEYNAADYEMGETTIESLEETLQGLTEKVESLGTVNLLAIDEYEELKKRYEFLMAQQKDLDDAREQLMETIRKINRTTKGLFEETFINVQKYFQQYYETLFRGGQAKLVLLDESNPLESGIDIVVRPPGKKLQNISLLSGGEKALTAIALLFALFTIKPSPFCVLDEVDAPLDEANIDRFLSVLRTFLDRSQFIIVTHNRKTIAMGDSLYGVTMEQAGVSKLVSVRVNTDSKSPSPADTAPAEDKKQDSVEEQVQA